jgi:hypothetical protein
MVMTAIYSIAPQDETAESGLLRQALSAVKRSWSAYIGWRIERLMIAGLRATDDGPSTDMGLERSQIEVAVKAGFDRYPLVMRYL